VTAPVSTTDEKDVEQVIVEEKARRRNVLQRLRDLVRDAQVVERQVVDDYARADEERRK
jgi:predicted protein tyrosine phosphatase